MRKHPEVTVSVFGQDCSPSRTCTAQELRDIGALFARAAEAIDNQEHGRLENNRAHIGLDFGGPFDEVEGLPELPLERAKK